MKNRKNNKGFSLVELIVVVAIMAVLVGVLAPAYLRYVEKSRAQKDASAVAEVVEAIQVAAAEEECYNAIGTGKEYTGTATGFAMSTQTADDLQAEVAKTVDDITYASKAWKDAGTAVKINVSIDADGSVNVVLSGNPS